MQRPVARGKDDGAVFVERCSEEGALCGAENDDGKADEQGDGEGAHEQRCDYACRCYDAGNVVNDQARDCPPRKVGHVCGDKERDKKNTRFNFNKHGLGFYVLFSVNEHIHAFFGSCSLTMSMCSYLRSTSAHSVNSNRQYFLMYAITVT